MNNDSPAIGEIWPVPVEFTGLDLPKTEYFLKDPFGYIPNLSDFEEELKILNSQGKLQVYWLSDKSDNWLTEKEAEIKIIYDGLPHQIKIIIPAGGSKLKKIMLSNIQMLGNIEIREINVK